MSVLVTGAAGFIGSHVAAALLDRGEDVIGVDNLNDYYSIALKEARLARLTGRPGFRLVKADVSDREAMFEILSPSSGIDRVAHLAAQAGVRHSLENPYVYIQTNLMGQVVVLEAIRRLPDFKSLIYASSSSVYGGNTKLPFSVADRVDQPISLYAATKKADELITQSYSHLWSIPAIGLRFFTVYGPWGRPDMAAYLFADAIMAGRPVRVFNEGRMRRDFTFIDDIVQGVLGALDHPPPKGEGAPHRVYNLGNHRSVELNDFIGVLERELGRTAIRQLEPMQPGDVPATFADIDDSRRDLGFDPKTGIEEGLARFVRWYKDYNGHG